MYIESVPNRKSPPAILLRESYRESGKVRKSTLCNLSGWPTSYVEGLLAYSKAAPSSPRIGTRSPSPARFPMATPRLPSEQRKKSASTPSLARKGTAAATSSWP